MQFSVSLFLRATVFITGAGVLVIEVAAVRALSPYYGSSLYVFSSVLTIILAALSLGYYYGGRLADRKPTHEPLYALITISGLLTLLAEFLILRVLPAADAVFSVFSGPLVFGFLFFFTPAFFLGIVSPYLVKLLSVSGGTDEIGSTAGSVFFWGTLGSITGSLLTGFVLIPFLGIRHSMVSTGIVLVVLGIKGLLVLGRLRNNVSVFSTINRYFSFIAFVIAVACILTVLIYRWQTPFPYTVLHESDGVYGHIIVYETTHRGEPVRALKRDTNNESIVALESNALIYEYTQFATWYDALVPDAERFLMIGGGAYSVPRTLLATDPDLEVAVVEIEPALYPLAERYFDLKPNERLTNHVMDGRVFLNQNTEPFDVIFMDAFGTDLTLPQHLATKEFFETLKANLTENGVLILNYIGRLETDAPSLTGSLTKTLASVFPNMRMYGVYVESPEARQNVMYVLRNGSSPVQLDEQTVAYRSGRVRSASELEVSHLEYLTHDEMVFTDDRAPIEYLMLSQYK